MVLTQVLKDGATAAARAWRGTVLLYVVTALLAGVAALVFRVGFASVFLFSDMPAQMMNGFDFPAYSELTAHGDGLMAVMRTIVPLFVILNMVAFACIGGGIITAVAEDDGVVRTKDILRSGGSYAGRFLRILVIELFLLVVVGAITGMIFGAAVSATSSSATSEMSVIRALIGYSFILLIPIAVVLAIGDYTRVIAVARDERSAVRAVGHGFAFVFRNFLTVFLVEVILIAATVALIALYLWIEGLTPMNTGGFILLMFVVQQAFVFLRMGVKTWNYGSAVALWEIRESQHERAKAIQAPLQPPAPVPTTSIEPPREAARARRRVKRAVRRNISVRKPRTVKRTPPRRKR